MLSIQKKKGISTVILISIMMGLIIMDAFLVEKNLIAQIGDKKESTIITQEEENNTSSSSGTLNLPKGGVQKSSGPNVLDLLTAMEFEQKPEKNQTILEQIIPQISIMRHIPKGGYHHLPLWAHSLETVHQLEKIFEEFSKQI